MQLLSLLFSTIKAKFVSLWTNIKKWTSKQFVLAKLLTAIRGFFSDTLSVKPRHSKDYYGFLAWLVSRKLVYAALLVLGVLSLFYLLVVNPVFQASDETDGLPIYSYDSLALRFVNDKVKIKADSGYIAYVGNVEEGACKGEGVLYDKEGNMVYSGEFANNMYNGVGKTYFKNGQMQYEGSFRDNIYEGEGALMRASGNREYVGNFSRGLKEGEGILYDPTGKVIFNGLFSRDRLVYSDFLGRSTQEARELYTGSTRIYRGKDEFIVTMPDINAMYEGSLVSDTVDDSININSVFVLENIFFVDGIPVTTINGLTDALGEPYYEGNTRLRLPEAVGVNELNTGGTAYFGKVDMTLTRLFDDAYDVESFDRDYTLYLYTYRYEGLMYTFFCKERFGSFEMYQITKE
ncbi:MAG: hypothetical protein K6F44_01915 [Lachnospiraceae bacterium]|nr:hypothetical protein [Lachnospiraceae bacterium]